MGELETERHIIDMIIMPVILLISSYLICRFVGVSSFLMLVLRMLIGRERQSDYLNDRDISSSVQAS